MGRQPERRGALHRAHNWYAQGGTGRVGEGRPVRRWVKNVFSPHGKGKHKHPGLQKGAVSKLLDRVKGIGLSGSLSGKLKKASGDVGVFGDYADRASSLTTEDADGNPVPGVVDGKSEVEWVTMQLQALLAWRNALITAHQVLAKKRAEVTSSLGYALMARGSLAQRIKVLGKNPKRNKKLLATLRGQLRQVDRLIPGLKTKRAALGGTNSDVMASLQDVQGLGSPMKVFKTLPAVGTLGGMVLDDQVRLRDLNAPRTTITDDSASERDSLFAEIGRTVVQRSAVRSIQDAVIQDFPDLLSRLPSFDGGGTVPGSRGTPQPILAHGAEGVFTPDQMAALSPSGGTQPVVVIVQDQAVKSDYIRVLAGDEAQKALRRVGGGRASLPGGGGGRLRG